MALERMEIVFLNELNRATREGILATYAECLQTVKGGRRAARGEIARHSVAPLEDELAASRAQN